MIFDVPTLETAGYEQAAETLLRSTCFLHAFFKVGQCRWSIQPRTRKRHTSHNQTSITQSASKKLVGEAGGVSSVYSLYEDKSAFGWRLSFRKKRGECSSEAGDHYARIILPLATLHLNAPRTQWATARGAVPSCLQEGVAPQQSAALGSDARMRCRARTVRTRWGRREILP